VQAQGLSKLNTNNNPTTKFVTMNKPGILNGSRESQSLMI
jgi:hypothetical protein